MIPRQQRSTLFPYTTLFRSDRLTSAQSLLKDLLISRRWFLVYKIRHTSRNHESRPRNPGDAHAAPQAPPPEWRNDVVDRKSTRLNSSHVKISYAVFCLKKKK